ncbi:MAG: hypothetical protein PHD10_03915 [Bacilli bacterium]|nr:hypothetical protein [Bacilli bacterium]MDD4608256.1 hypothetical protein [Bacilli bacterium]
MKDKLVVKVTAEQLYRRKLLMKILKMAFLILLLLFAIIYLILYVVNSGGYFTITLDRNLRYKSSIKMSSNSNFGELETIIKVKSLEYMDNITESWIPPDINEKEGNNSKDNYLAYTFFIKNEGESQIDYIREIKIESVIKNVDEAARVALYFNDEKKVYAKRNASGEPEKGTIKFISNHQVLKEKRKKFKPGEVDKYTIVIWLEGNDEDCVDDIIGGEMKMSMLITEELKKGE